MSEEKKIAVTEEIKEARQLSEEELEKVSGGKANTVGVIPIIFAQTIVPMSLQIDPK
ncbi:MAG: class IIb bacteriocin, lactobin A/cerein 7B family [Ruminococcus sp.]|nr:class IIb bacteriocin, lactobin A/cerein 7B family [Ruminococcus sp.]